MTKKCNKKGVDMGKIKGGPDGGISGLVGNVVFYGYNGKTYIRTVQKQRAKNSWSERQVLHRQRFKAVKAFWARFDYSPIQGIWKVAEKGRRGDNLFVSINMPAFGPDGALMDPERLHFSAGQLPLPFKFSAVRSVDDPSKVEVTWKNNQSSALESSADELMMMSGNGEEFAGPIATGFTRRQESAFIDLTALPGTTNGIYLFFASEKRKMYSPDQYFGL
jgi:hypothetical protein